MKKGIITKIIFILLIVFMVASFAACGGKTPPPDEKPPEIITPVEKADNIATLDDVLSIVGGLQNLATGFDSIDDEMHFDISLSLMYEQDQYSIQVQGNIYNVDNFMDNELAIYVKDSKGIKVLDAFLKGDIIYLDQKVTATNGRTKFSNLGGLGISKALSAFPAYLSGKDLKLASKLDGVDEALASMSTFLDIVFEMEVLLYEETDDAYILSLDASAIGELIPIIADFMKPDPKKPVDEDAMDLQGVLDFALQLLFGEKNPDKIVDVAAADMPTIEIRALKKGGTASDKKSVSGIVIFFEGKLDTDENAAKETIQLGINIAALDNDEPVAITFPALSGFVEGALKASLTLDLGMKDLFLKADIFADPNFLNTEGEVTTAYLKAIDKEGNNIADLDAEYDGEFLYFDLAGLYTMMNIAIDETNTMYKVPFAFFAKADPLMPTNADAPVVPTASVFPFELTKDLLGFIIGKIDVLFNILKDTAVNKSLALDANMLLNLTNGILVKTGTTTTYGRTDMIGDLEGWIAQFAEGYVAETEYTATEITDFAKSVVFEITGVDATVANLINAAGQNNVYLAIGLVEDALGLEIDLTKGTGTSVQNVVKLSIELDVVPLTVFDRPEKNYEGALDLMEKDNQTYILDELVVLLDAYRDNAYKPVTA